MAAPRIDFDPDFASNAEWAAMYRACGLQVVPSYKPDEAPNNWKRPKLADWTHLQEEQVPDATFERWYGPVGSYAKHSSMGLITGRASGNVFVVDLDDHTKPQAAEWWSQVSEGRTYITAEQRTGGGGRQLFFRAPLYWKAPTNKTPIGVDIRGQGGFAVMPPSLHASGVEYAWAPDRAPWQVGIAEAPNWLLNAVERLVAEHGGGHTTAGDRGPVERTAATSDYDGFGNITDGREDYMTRVVWGAVLDLYREAPIKPGADESMKAMQAAYEIYARKATTRLPGEERERGLEREGRGLSLFQAKWDRAMAQWDGKVSEEAKQPRPLPEGNRSEALSFHDVRPETPSEGTQPRFAFETVADLRKLPPVQWLVKGWIPAGSTGIFYGKWAAGKSFIGFDLALHLAYGMKDWHGVELPGEPRDVLVIAREGHQGFVNRIDAFKKHYGIIDDTDRLVFMRASVSFMSADDFNALCAAVRGHGAPFVLTLIDTVARVLPGVDMNEQQTVTAFMERCQVLGSVTGAAAIGVHHQNKSGGMMGSTYFEANADFVFEVERLGEEDEPLRSGEITCTKMKDGEDRWKRSVAYEKVILSPITDEVSSLVVKAIAGPKVVAVSDGWPDKDVCRRILAAAHEAWSRGNPWSSYPHAKRHGRYAPAIISREFEVRANIAQQMVETWLMNEVLTVDIRNTDTKLKGLKVTGGID